MLVYKGQLFFRVFFCFFLKKIFFCWQINALNLGFIDVFNTTKCLKKGYLDRVDYEITFFCF